MSSGSDDAADRPRSNTIRFACTAPSAMSHPAMLEGRQLAIFVDCDDARGHSCKDGWNSVADFPVGESVFRGCLIRGVVGASDRMVEVGQEFQLRCVQGSCRKADQRSSALPADPQRKQR